MKLTSILVTLSVLLHHAIAYHHGGQHALLEIEMAAWQTGFINGVILLLPLLGVALVWTRWRRVGAFAVLIGMLGALLFGIVHHYLLVSPDHITHLPPGPTHVHSAFIWTAAAIAMLEGLGGIFAAYLAATTPPELT